MILVQLLLLALSRACAFNIDTQAPIVRSGAHPTDAKYFGYSVAPYANSEGKWILVGAPLDDSDGMERFGALYRCKLAKDSKCEPFTGYPDPIRELDPLFPGVLRDRDHVRNQWLGVSVAANPNGIIVTCAHRYVDFRANFQYYDPIGRCFLFNSTFHIRPVLAPCKNRLEGIHGFSFCQSGSDVALANDGKQILLGNPGTFNWAGNIDIVNSSDYETVALSYARDVGSSEIGYVAYSVAFGSFKFYESTNEFVVGAPRSMSYTGRVIVLRYTSVGRVLVSVAKRGSQVGAYFGHSVVAVDLNRDGYDDLVVGAPYYTGQLRDQGQVYTYINTQNNDFMLDRILTGPLARGAFGYAIATVGDVNLDGFTDIVIGAPFADDPTVYLYTTSLKGLVASPLQVIPSSGLNLNFSIPGFGAALAGGVDLDENSYGDIVVGAFRSEKAVVLRSKPVATIVATLELTPKTLVYLTTNQFKAELCMKYDGVVRESSLNVEFSIEVDRSRSVVGLNPWATFSGPAKSAKVSGTRNVTSNFACTTFSLVVQSQSETLIRPQEVILDVAYALPPEPQMPSSYGGNPPIRPLSPVARNGVQTNSVFLVSGCRGNQTCIPDLRVASARVVSGSGETVSSVSLGEDNLVNLTVLVENRKETAYAVKVNVTFLKELKLKRISLNQKMISCTNETKGDALVTYTCNVGDSLASNSQVRLDFVLLLASVSSMTNKFNFTIEAESANAENGTLHDNVLTTPFITVIKKADFGLQGSTPSQVSIDPANPFGSGLILPKTIEEIGPSVVHTYIVQNRGPSPIPETVVSITWPHRTADNRYLLYLTGVDVKGRASCNAEELNLINAANHLQPTQATSFTDSRLNSTVVLQNRRRRRRRRRETDITSGCEAGGVYQTDCVTFQCKISQLSANETVDIKVQARLYEQTLLQDNILNLTLSSVAAFDSSPNLVQVVTGLNTLLKKTAVITNIVSAEKPTIKEERKPWVIPVVVVASVVFLTLLIALLVWLGFFRRPAKEKLQEEKKQLNAENEGEG